MLTVFKENFSVMGQVLTILLLPVFNPVNPQNAEVKSLHLKILSIDSKGRFTWH